MVPDLPDIQFLFIGGGSRFGDLVRCVRERRLEPMFRFLPYQERSALRYSLGAADVHLLSLRPQLEGLILPSKFYGIAAAGRPLIAITAPDGEIAGLTRRHGCGLVVPPGEADALANALRRLSTEPGRVAAMGAQARAMLDAHFTRRRAFERWHGVLEAVA